MKGGWLSTSRSKPGQGNIWRLQISGRRSLSNTIDDNLCCHLLFGEAASTASAFTGWMYPWPFLTYILFLLPLGILNATLPVNSVVPLHPQQTSECIGGCYSLLPGSCNLSYFSLAYPWAMYLLAVYVGKPLLMHKIRKVSHCSVLQGYK